MRCDIITLFPRLFDSYFSDSILKRAIDKKSLTIALYNIRDFALDKHKKVDDTPYGGGAGMVLKVEPIFRAMEAVKAQSNRDDFGLHTTRTILLSAKGKRFVQADVSRLARYNQLIFICGRYEGVDERVAEYIVDEELSIGDFVLTGGELGAMVVIDAVTRLLPEVLGNAESVVIESHTMEGVLEYPQYTKPKEFLGWKVPEVLLRGNHKAIEVWRSQKKMLQSTAQQDG
jgi:tRNA (guanine37-N1)-methyltransferase